MNDKKKSIYTGIGIVFICFIIFISRVYYKGWKLEEVHKEYQTIEYAHSTISSVQQIHKIEGYKRSLGAVFITLSNNKKYKISAKRIDFSKDHIDEILLAGDSIIKKSNNDTLVVFEANSSVEKGRYLIKPFKTDK